jgi:hypothetical protein
MHRIPCNVELLFVFSWVVVLPCSVDPRKPPLYELAIYTSLQVSEMLQLCALSPSPVAAHPKLWLGRLLSQNLALT